MVGLDPGHWGLIFGLMWFHILGVFFVDLKFFLSKL